MFDQLVCMCVYVHVDMCTCSPRGFKRVELLFHSAREAASDMRSNRINQIASVEFHERLLVVVAV